MQFHFLDPPHLERLWSRRWRSLSLQSLLELRSWLLPRRRLRLDSLLSPRALSPSALALTSPERSRFSSASSAGLPCDGTSAS